MSERENSVSKSLALDYILQEQLHPDLYEDVYQQVRVEYYPPRGDAQEGWDNVEIFGRWATHADQD